MLTLVCTGLILCLGYGIKETMDNWKGDDDE